jgi:hypothetical protein
MPIDVVAAAVVEGRRLLLVPKRQAPDIFYLPGGKRDAGEDDLACTPRARRGTRRRGGRSGALARGRRARRARARPAIADAGLSRPARRPPFAGGRDRAAALVAARHSSTTGSGDRAPRHPRADGGRPDRLVASRSRSGSRLGPGCCSSTNSASPAAFVTWSRCAGAERRVSLGTSPSVSLRQRSQRVPGAWRARAARI